MSKEDIKINSNDSNGTSGVKKFINWLFINRETQNYTFGQKPNVSLIAFIISKAVELIVENESVTQIAAWASAGFILWWGADEIIRGVNPWRKILGSVVLFAYFIRFL